MAPDQATIRDASTVILWRDSPEGPQVLMGQRGAGAAFMPSKYVFPGGAVDAEDINGPQQMDGLATGCQRRLGLLVAPVGPSPAALALAARRELHEETGLTLAPDRPMRFVFRAITPPGRTRRFDARFFLVSATHVAGDQLGFQDASDELRHLHWIALGAARMLDLPFITEIVLAEVAALLAGKPSSGVPFFDNSGPVPTFRRLD